MKIERKPTRRVKVGSVYIGANQPIAVQSMCATRTQDIDATVEQAEQLRAAGASIVRIAIDSDKDAQALMEIRHQTTATLSVDLQENYRLAAKIADSVDKIRYNPGHLHHHEKQKSVPEKVKWLVDVARDHGCAIRIGVNCGSVAPEFLERYPDSQMKAIVESAAYHCELMEEFEFENYVVSLKDSDPQKVIEANEQFSERMPHVPLHLGVTEAGLPPDGVIKTRIAFEKLLAKGIGDTIRVSLTLPNPQKYEEVVVGNKIVEDVYAGRFISVPEFGKGLNIISCPSCSRVENERFVELAQKVQELTAYAKEHQVTIAVMGCRVNGPGETDDADLGLWCGPTHVNFKKKAQDIGAFTYDEILPKLLQELNALIQKQNT
ncbi:MAG: 4-hydroxy-3-methylbut-2-en-1-yl diphosphate synthase [Acidobacteria bacterium]|nr:MAG: 4-hydroxy-3-methylbut-2-en-1-yl diphosphate synthase [Acidobacteriota bacterium]